MLRILILATARNCIAAKRLAREATIRGHQVMVVNPQDLFLLISNSESGYDRLYFVDGKKKVSRIAIKDCDCIIPRIGDHTIYGAFVVEHLHRNLGIFSTASAEGIRNASNQMITVQRLSSYGLPTPRTVFANNPNHIEHLVQRVGGYPVVVKLLHGSGGSGVTLLRDKSTALSTLQSFFKSGASVIIQEYLESGGTDYRVVVIGNQVAASFKRTAQKHEFRANLKQGGHGTPVKLSREDTDLCIHAANAVNLNVVGMDLIKSAGKTYVVEANANFGYQVESITQVNVAQKTIEFCEKNYRIKDVERTRINALQGLLLEERLNSDIQLKRAQALAHEFGSFMNDPYLREVFNRSRGKKIVYQDRDHKRKQIVVSSIRDIYQVMLDCFYIK
jgi:ribosomal protein S6--L-glutamate ligase